MLEDGKVRRKINKQEELTEIEVIERYILLLFGAVDRPIPSPEHLQKEMFILSKANPKIANFITFEKHHKGPYSGDVVDLVSNPLYHEGAYRWGHGGKIYLTPEGKKIYEDLVKNYSDNPKFKEMLGMIKMIRDLYDKLSTDELLFLIYVTYPEYKELSEISNELLSSPKREEIAKKLLEKGVITEMRYTELVTYNG